MRATPTRSSRTRGRLAAALLVAAGLALGIGIQPVAADDDETPDTPTLMTLRLEGTDAFVTFRDNSEDEEGFRVTLRERDRPDRIALTNLRSTAVPGVGREVTHTMSGILPGVALCATVHSYRNEHSVAISVGVPVPTTTLMESPESNAVCVDPALQAMAPDLAIANIRGREEVEGRIGMEGAYLVAFRNDGDDAEGTVVVDIDTSGVLTLADQTPVRAGWEADGFKCVTTPPSGVATSSMRCSGGSLKKGQSTNPAIMVRFTRPGYGYIHASISVSGGPADSDTKDNGQTLGVRVY